MDELRFVLRPVEHVLKRPGRAAPAARLLRDGCERFESALRPRAAIGRNYFHQQGIGAEPIDGIAGDGVELRPSEGAGLSRRGVDNPKCARRVGRENNDGDMATVGGPRGICEARSRREAGDERFATVRDGFERELSERDRSIVGVGRWVEAETCEPEFGSGEVGD